ncbi:hypothetical protein CC1G_07050 [Coprinopsis cinerea okayama7|uniref:Uncharacterized protein n=1 Tax=Coprinopsis cinerea (strain Okayama-7 / 130 / ATCC MYA-4618 / FGSC 9003) TaxID=240176 RepID=A8NU93_COPC7|nr:hypothetical protein CC1G_07050 [Coprinopsis cinerea okayama7\|eukprot:XP_001836403.1 hypothetical protein CC1G_07050 [Coprinopsis cinerea okayama7\
MSLFANVLGFATFGLAARFGQLALQQRNLFSNPGGHAIAMGVFGYAGYWAYHWDQKAVEIIADSRRQIEERRRKTLANVEAAAARQLDETQ